MTKQQKIFKEINYLLDEIVNAIERGDIELSRLRIIIQDIDTLINNLEKKKIIDPFPA